jgi:hypothetical protein
MGLLLLYVLGASAALIVIFAVVALVDNRISYGSWRKRSDKGGSAP